MCRKTWADATKSKIRACPHILDQSTGPSTISLLPETRIPSRLSLLFVAWSIFRVLASTFYKRLNAQTLEQTPGSHYSTIMRYWTSLGHQRIAGFRLPSFYYRRPVIVHPTHRTSSSGGCSIVEEGISSGKFSSNIHHPTHQQVTLPPLPIYPTLQSLDQQPQSSSPPPGRTLGLK